MKLRIFFAENAKHKSTGLKIFYKKLNTGPNEAYGGV